MLLISFFLNFEEEEEEKLRKWKVNKSTRRSYVAHARVTRTWCPLHERRVSILNRRKNGRTRPFIKMRSCTVTTRNNGFKGTNKSYMLLEDFCYCLYEKFK